MSPPSPQALYFGPAPDLLFGWLHRPPPGSLAGVGLVICQPFGFEEVSAHPSLRHLANAAAESGIPVLRYDYPGCGNSAGDESAADLLAAWVRSVHAAADTLRRATGLRRVTLLGLRLGAAIASLAALERDDVAGLVALAPVVRGRAYLRELSLLEQTSPAGAAAPAPGAEGVVESAGFVMSAATAASVAAIDLRRLARAPAAQVLIVERDDLPPAPEWPAALAALGSTVSVERWPGYGGMMDDPQRTVPPQRIVEGVVRRLQAWQAETTLELVATQPVGESVLREGAVVERPVQIDVAGTPLAGILSLPASGAVAGAPALLMLNAGAVHLIGPNRLWVRLARRWAARGLAVLRIDLSGIGDSPPPAGAADHVVYSPQALGDVAAAMAWLEREVGASGCHLLGLCSGAYHAFRSATRGAVVPASALMVNPLTFFWHDGDALRDVHDYEVAGLSARYRDKLFTLDPWRRLLRGELDLGLIATVTHRRLAQALLPWKLALARALGRTLDDDLAAELEAAARRGVPLRFVFGAEASGLALLQRQAGGRALVRLQRRGSLSIECVERSDHTFTRLEARERLVRALDRLVAAATGR